MTGKITRHSPTDTFPDIMRRMASQFDVVIRRCNFKRKPYLFDEGSVVLSFAFLFEDMLGAGVVLLGDTSGACCDVERLPFGTRNSVVGEA